MTNAYATPFLVMMTASAITRATIITKIAQVSAATPKPSQLADTRKAATFAIDAIVIHPRYTLKGR
jgi:hypothetical protein